MTAIEINFDGIVGPTHNYSGLSYGNVASIKSGQALSNPKEAALQGLEKMKALYDRGIHQAVLPPHERPFLPILRDLGFKGENGDILETAYRHSPEILLACSSAASMWTANAATISPSADTLDGKLHITPANLSSKFHRSLEASFTETLFRTIFRDSHLFAVHSPLPLGEYFADEGAANHCRFCKNYADPGVELFVWGRSSFKDNVRKPMKFPARQTFEAFQAIARRHQLPEERVVFAQQNPQVIDQGVFHNDVICVNNQQVLFFHETAFIHTNEVIRELQSKGQELTLIAVPTARITVEDAVTSYLFNSQIISLPDSTMHMIAPSECLEMDVIRSFLKEMVEDQSNPINGISYFNLHQSMANGGGPACLRLRIVVTQEELKAMHQGVLFDENLYLQLKQWVERNYRDQLRPSDLKDRALLDEVYQALDELTEILDLGPIYPFQQ